MEIQIIEGSHGGLQVTIKCEKVNEEVLRLKSHINRFRGKLTAKRDHETVFVELPANQALGISEQILQQKNEGIQVLAGVAVDIEDGTALVGRFCDSLETGLLLPDQSDGFAEAVLGDLDRLLGRGIALALLFPVLAVLH